VRKKVFYIYTNIVTKQGGKYARNNISRNTPIVRAKNVRKKIFGKKCEKRFLKSHEYRDLKWGEKRESIFPETQQIVRAKNVWKKKCRKNVRKNVLSIHANIVSKKWGGKTRETIFPETQQIVRAKNVRKKIVEKNCEKTFFIITRIS